MLTRGKVLNQVLRQEKKFLINVADAKALAHRLSGMMREDAHNGADGYMIRSLYFDTSGDSDYFDKVAGVEVRKKIRLRIYNPKAEFAMLEMKQKQGEQQLKRSLKVSKADALKLIDGNYTPLLSYREKFAAECFGIMNARSYRPRTIVEYNRKAFILDVNSTRITFDSRIIATESSFDIFDEKLNMFPVLDLYDTVMEVKYNGFLMSYVKQMINSVDKSELSVSKYILARHSSYLTHI